MKKNAIRWSSNLENALDVGVKPYWYTVCHAQNELPEHPEKNPWNQDEAEFETTVYLADDCVITMRPARYSLNTDGGGDYEKDHYFLEVSNQDASVILSSAQTYRWEEVNQLALFFRGISFTAATRVWKVKKP
ncbi:hypothetical protein [Pseudomonas sp. RC10]|uniref:hypothetical protein n=1 Tax=Pseudomonas bambusae TaxID=3139142 RepID=UPI0031395463